MPADSAEMTPVRAAYIPVVTWLPAWIANDKGFFERDGLNVSLTVTQHLSVLPGTLGRQFALVPSTAAALINAVAGGVDCVLGAWQALETKSRPSRCVSV